MLPGPKKVAEPEKELRFTRSAQAQTFYLLASLLLISSVTFIAVALTPEPPVPLWSAIVPAVFALPLLWIGVRCNRYAYIILTPLGVEIFPFFKARENLQVIYWSEIDLAEIKDKNLYLHYNKEQTAGLVAALSPILQKSHPLLERAIEGVMANRLPEEPSAK